MHSSNLYLNTYLCETKILANAQRQKHKQIMHIRRKSEAYTHTHTHTECIYFNAFMGTFT